MIIKYLLNNFIFEMFPHNSYFNKFRRYRRKKMINLTINAINLINVINIRIIIIIKRDLKKRLTITTIDYSLIIIDLTTI